MKQQKTLTNPLEEYFQNNKGHLIDKWVHYFDVYHKYFSQFRGKKITLLEFGVANGGSLQMWKDYFGANARIIGVDIDKRCKNLEEEQIEIYIGDQESRYFLKNLIKQTGPLDIVIDDGGHFMNQQIITFEEVFCAVKNGGIFVTEDLHSSYWKEFNGGYKKNGTFIEYSKNLIDQIQAWHSRDQRLKINDRTRTLKGIHIYNGIIVFEKNNIKSPFSEKKGFSSFSTVTLPKDLRYHFSKLIKFCLNIHNIYYSYMPPG